MRSKLKRRSFESVIQAQVEAETEGRREWDEDEEYMMDCDNSMCTYIAIEGII